jgi:N6-L-threonylcarbamoyladenine synthase
MRLNKKILKILAIETSCDETAAAVIEVRGSSNQLSVISKNTDNRLPITDNLDIKILSNVVASQIKIHQQYGGVFPELASRAHTEKIIPVVEEALAQSNSYPLSVIGRKNTDNQLPITNLLNTIDLIAVTAGPGLIGSLMVGVNAAKTLSYVTKKPIISINHWLGHIYSNFVGEKFKIQNANLKIARVSGSYSHCFRWAYGVSANGKSQENKNHWPNLG